MVFKTYHFCLQQLDAVLADPGSIDLKNLPPMPVVQAQVAPSLPVSETPSAAKIEEMDLPSELNQEEASKIFNAPVSAETPMEAMQQRLEKYKSTMNQATAENNSSKARRLGRIVKQYEVAIKDFKAGKPVNFDDLPCPPGFPPIPSLSEKKAPAPPPPKQEPKVPESRVAEPPKPPLKRGMSTTASKQLVYLVERQTLFKQAALEAKKRGEVDQAKEYLRNARGFDPLIEATKSGLPIDVTSIPTPPQLNDNDFVILDADREDVGGTAATSEIRGKPSSVFYGQDEDREETFRKVEAELVKQIEVRTSFCFFSF